MNTAYDKNSKSTVVKFTVEQFLKIIDNIPVCINVLNDKAESVYCNNYTVDLYGVKTKNDFMNCFYDLTTENQPNGINSKIAFSEYVLTALEKGEVHFNWLDIKATGEELPLFISIYKLNTKSDQGEELLVSTMRDLRPYLAGFEEEEQFNDYYYNQITYKDLFNSVAELTDEWFWIYNVNMATIQFFGKGREILGLESKKMPFPSYVVDSGMVYPDDLDVFLKFDENLKTGIVNPCEVRFISASGSTRYYKITYKTIYDKSGKPLFSIGKTYDIDKQKRLEVLSKTDLLTNCLNKITTENVIKDIIDSNPESSHALFIIDVDDFKSVNDELGHYFGDNVLCDIAKNLHSNFRNVDIIGRIGGDEFLVFIKNISNENVIISKAEAIATAFQNSYSGENKDYKVSGSIGVALYPKHATTYEGLYKCADKALYASKMAGKDRYTLYSDKLSDINTKNLTAVDNANKVSHSYYDVDIVSSVFDLMYEADDAAKAMNTVVRVLATHMKANRCYIAQTFDKGESYGITYEWSINEEDKKIDVFKDIKLEDVREFFEELEINGIMHSNSSLFLQVKNNTNIPSPKNPSAYLLAQIKGKGHTRLILGLDDDNPNRVWSEKEINTVQYTIKMVSIFLSLTKNNN